jgi:hypothetical protein
MHPGDADKLIVLLKSVLPLFHHGKRTQYSIEIIALLWDALLLLSPVEADALRQSMFFCNGAHVFSVDLNYEFVVGLIKKIIANLGANATLANVNTYDVWYSIHIRPVRGGP